MTRLSILLVFLVCWGSGGINKQSHLVTAAAKDNENYNFALIGKSKSNPFFDFVAEGCKVKAKLLSVGGRNITCHYYGTETEDPQAQAQIVADLVNKAKSGVKLDGISMSVINTEVASKAIQLARDAGIPVVTFDSDAPQSARQAYIGTDNLMFGRELGKLLLQLDPEGGKYGIVAAGSPNVQLRVKGANEYLARSPWSPVADSPKSSEDRIDVALKVMWEFAANPEIRAIIAVGGWPMFNTSGWQDFVDSNRHLTLISGDSLPQQLDLINRGYVDALVGQLPYNMGEMSVEILMQLNEGTFDHAENVRFGTAFLEILLFPLVLPPVSVNNNYLGGLVWMGYIFFAVIAVLSIGFCGWTYLNRKDRVVVASQPPFLYMICMGTIILASTMIPLTFDDNQYSQEACNRACISMPWLGSFGFTTTFAALFSKLWRVNRIFHNPNKFQRVVVQTKDVLLPYGVLTGANLIVLITWTVLSPMEYVRHDGDGTDGWNRVIYTYGICESSGHANLVYLICLAVINFGVLLLANYQAYEARTVSTEFSESRYIAIIMASMMQAFVVGIPIVFLIREEPIPYFVVLTSLLFIICLSVLLLMFLPKMAILQKKKMADARARKSNRNMPVVLSTGAARSEQEGGLRVRVHQPYSDSFARRRGQVHVTGVDFDEPPTLIANTTKSQQGYVSSSEDEEAHSRSGSPEHHEGLIQANHDLEDITEEHSNHLNGVSAVLNQDVNRTKHSSEAVENLVRTNSARGYAEAGEQDMVDDNPAMPEHRPERSA